LDQQIKRYDFSKFWLKSDSKFYFDSSLNWRLTRGAFSLADAGSIGSAIWNVGSKEVWTHKIDRYLST
jgi:hypothetical protein